MFNYTVSYSYGQMYHITLDFLYLNVLNHSIWIVIFFFKTKLLTSKSVDDLDFFFLVLKAFFKNKWEKEIIYNLLNSNIHIDICDTLYSAQIKKWLNLLHFCLYAFAEFILPKTEFYCFKRECLLNCVSSDCVWRNSL